AKITSIPTKSLLFPEQIIFELRKQLPQKSTDYWPAISHAAATEIEIDKLSRFERRTLFFISIAAHGISESSLIRCLKKRNSECMDASSRLQNEGLIHSRNDSLFPSLPADISFERMRKSEIRMLASQMLKELPSDQNMFVIYQVAMFAGDKAKTARA